MSVKDENGNVMSNEQYDDKITEKLKSYNVDYVLLIGWMRILTDKFVEYWKNRVINIHPR